MNDNYVDDEVKVDIIDSNCEGKKSQALQQWLLRVYALIKEFQFQFNFYFLLKVAAFIVLMFRQNKE